MMSHTSLSLGSLNMLILVGLIVYSCKKRHGHRSVDGAMEILHPPSAPPAPLPTDPLHLSELQVRLSRLEAVTRELQTKMERTAQQEATLGGLEREHEQLLTALM